MDSAKVIRLAELAGSVSYSPPPMRAVRGVSLEFQQLDKFAALIQQSMIDEGWRSPEWMPIETAPKDGTLILTCNTGFYYPQCGVWASWHPDAQGKEWWRTTEVCGNKLYPTHWMPLPDYPRKERE